MRLLESPSSLTYTVIPHVIVGATGSTAGTISHPCTFQVTDRPTRPLFLDMYKISGNCE